MRSVNLCALAVVLGILFGGCQRSTEPIKEAHRIKLATTTSTQDSGLLDVLLPPFEQSFDIAVDVIAVGTGKALKLGERGDVDVLLVHAPAAEQQFVDQGFGVNRRSVMFNDFVIVGPPEDPAGIHGNDAVAALRHIEAAGATFTSRGDDSGTHKKEQHLWEEAGLKPEGKWYLEVGQGMGATLRIAYEKRAYCLVDRATYLALSDQLDLSILCENDPRLRNPYSVIAVNPSRHPHVRYVESMMFIGWLTSVEGQRLIGEYRKHDTVLFHPSAYPDTARSQQEP